MLSCGSKKRRAGAPADAGAKRGKGVKSPSSKKKAALTPIDEAGDAATAEPAPAAEAEEPELLLDDVATATGALALGGVLLPQEPQDPQEEEEAARASGKGGSSSSSGAALFEREHAPSPSRHMLATRTSTSAESGGAASSGRGAAATSSPWISHFSLL